jgi:hypothetical protein
VPEELNLIIVLEPDVVTVGDPVVIPEYAAVGTERITTPEPPEEDVPTETPNVPPPPPPPPPVFAVPF